MFHISISIEKFKFISYYIKNIENKWRDDGMWVDHSDVTASTQKWPKKAGDLLDKARKLPCGPPSFRKLIMTHQNWTDHRFWPNLWKNKQKMKTGRTKHSWNGAKALRHCHMTMTRKMNKPKKTAGPQRNFRALFGRSPTFFGHF